MSNPIQGIQVIPPGLLGYFNIKRNGINPDTLVGQYSPSIEMRDWLFHAGAENWITSRNGGVTPTIGLGPGPAVLGFKGFVTPIIVPEGEWWYVHDFTVTTESTLVATDTVSFCVGYANPQNAPFTFCIQGDRQPLITGAATGRSGFSHAHNFFVPPGSSLGFLLVANDTASTVDYFGYLRFTPLPT